jgi:uncharacterized DUF497 family protein
MKRIYMINESTGFDWDEHNLIKNWNKHQVSYWECEETFFNKPLIVKDDEEHSSEEKRYYALGRTDEGRQIFIAFTMRDTVIRPISFRDMTKRERRIYEQYKKS